MNVGDVLKADVFAAGDKVDVAGVSKGKATRALSSALASTVCVRATAPVLLLVMQVLWALFPTPLACSPAKRLPGHMGFVRVTVQNLTVVKVDTENNLIAVKGAVPGSKAPSSLWPTA